MKQLLAFIVLLTALLGCVIGYLLIDIDRTMASLDSLLGATSPSEPPPSSSEPQTEETSAPTEPEAAPTEPSRQEPPGLPGEERYIYRQLDEARQALYRKVYDALADMAPNVILSPEEQRRFQNEELLDLFNYVLDDNPEFFWVDQGITISTLRTGDSVYPTELRFTYLFDAGERASIRAELEAYEARCLEGLDPDAPVFEQILHVYEYIIDHTEYALDARYNQNMISVALYGQSVCKGYARMTQFLLNRLGIPCTTVNGYAGEPHSWNLVKADGDYYYLDVTWGDPQKLAPTDEGAEYPNINYQYFLITDEELAVTHKTEEKYPLPPCTATALNYYAYTGRLFDRYDRDAIATALLEDFDAGKNMATIRFTREELYLDAMYTLIDRYEVHEILAGTEAYRSNSNTYAYSYDNDFYILNFLLQG